MVQRALTDSGGELRSNYLSIATCSMSGVSTDSQVDFEVHLRDVDTMDQNGHI